MISGSRLGREGVGRSRCKTRARLGEGGTKEKKTKLAGCLFFSKKGWKKKIGCVFLFLIPIFLLYASEEKFQLVCFFFFIKGDKRIKVNPLLTVRYPQPAVCRLLPLPVLPPGFRSGKKRCRDGRRFYLFSNRSGRPDGFAWKAARRSSRAVGIFRGRFLWRFCRLISEFGKHPDSRFFRIQPLCEKEPEAG